MYEHHGHGCTARDREMLVAAYAPVVAFAVALSAAQFARMCRNRKAGLG
jgi:hypothetical protein